MINNAPSTGYSRVVNSCHSLHSNVSIKQQQIMKLNLQTQNVFRCHVNQNVKVLLLVTVIIKMVTTELPN